YEQKAVAILETLIALGIKNMRIGPSLPAFVSPNIMKMLQERYNIIPIGDPDNDLKAMLGE
ncbi:MAG: hydroxylamine reductase, partial [Thermoplasmata archaeon]